MFLALWQQSSQIGCGLKKVDIKETFDLSLQYCEGKRVLNLLQRMKAITDLKLCMQ